MPLSRGRLITIAFIVVVVLGLVFLRAPTPHLATKPEPLPSLGPFELTNTVLTSWIVVLTIIVTVYFGTRRRDLVPRGFQNVFEAAIEAFYGLVVSVAGEKNGRRFFPVVATIFFFVLAPNWLSLLPVFNSIGLVKEQEHGFVMEKTEVGSLSVGYVSLSSPSDLRLTGGGTIDEDDADAHEKFAEAKEDGKLVGELLPVFRGPNTDINTPLALAIVSAIAERAG